LFAESRFCRTMRDGAAHGPIETEITPEMVEAVVAAFREWQTEIIRPRGMDRPHQLGLKVVRALLPFFRPHN
jgi:hypothetical protein